MWWKNIKNNKSGSSRCQAVGSLLALVLISIFSFGCSVNNQIATTPESENLPYTLSILEEVFDGNTLFLSAKVVAGSSKQSDLPVRQVVRLKTVSNGELIAESLFPDPKENEKFTLTANANGFTDYQLDLLWGQEAIELLKSIDPIQFIKLDQVHLTSPDEKGVRFIEGVFINNGVQNINNIQLLVDFVFVPAGQYLDLDKLNLDNINEESTSQIEVEGIEVPPGESRPFSIEIASPLPEEEGLKGSWQVFVRTKI